MTAPLLSVVVLNHNKKDKAIRCLESVRSLDWPRVEILFVDNASSDGSVEEVRGRFGDSVSTLARSENDVASARNQGIRQARGEIVLTLDNDILLPDPQIVRKAEALFRQFPKVGLLTPRISSPEAPGSFQAEHWWHPFDRADHEESFFQTSYFPEAAAFFRAEALVEAGGYDERFFMGFEQADLAIRLIRKGWRILYCPSLVCIEDDARAEFVRQRRTIHYYNLRNKLWTAWKHYPAGPAVRYALAKTAIALARGIRYGYPDLVLRAAVRGMYPPRSIRGDRLPMSPEEWSAFLEAQMGILVETPNEG